jgi:hypothetical protein
MNKKMKQILIDKMELIDNPIVQFKNNETYIEYYNDSNEIVDDYTVNIVNSIIPKKTIEEKKQAIATYILNNGLESLQDATINDIYEEIKIESYIDDIEKKVTEEEKRTIALQKYQSYKGKYYKVSTSDYIFMYHVKDVDVKDYYGTYEGTFSSQIITIHKNNQISIKEDTATDFINLEELKKKAIAEHKKSIAPNKTQKLFIDMGFVFSSRTNAKCKELSLELKYEQQGDFTLLIGLTTKGRFNIQHPKEKLQMEIDRLFIKHFKKELER